ncbi:MAG TPA: hypothetical protein VG650_02290 [Mycobacteriales bacterium]|nr:hypothetical protein [Mycobacteriales bacterium]
MTGDLAGSPRWKGQQGRLEVWYATATDRATGTGVWAHHERISPTSGDPYAHGWIALFPPDAAPVVERYGPEHYGDLAAGQWFTSASASVGEGHLRGAGAAGASWDLTWTDAERPMWTLPRRVWQRELLPSAHVVLAPKAAMRGAVQVGGHELALDGPGAVAHIYGHGNAERWGWLHADLDDDTSLEIVAAVARRPGMRALPPLAFVQLRREGKDWPGDPLLTAPLFRTRLSSPTWRVRGVVGRTRLTVTVHQPDDRCVRLDYTDPNGDGAVCTNTERADVDVKVDRWKGRWITEAEWSLEGTGHSELGTRR